MLLLHKARVATAVDDILEGFSVEAIAFVVYGGVGTLLLCKYLAAPINRNADQLFHGHFWAFEVATAGSSIPGVCLRLA
ncbi:hypothetical protein [Microvirga zambiensis]|uniref:hypothetical protein n=1 Tax=Microvirga zambiensis TaxID=1402137 RepID=UPI00191FDE12|nr:hypothetical protein [Microvirga zambiensis]